MYIGPNMPPLVEAEVEATTDMVVGIIKDYRSRKYQLRPDYRFTIIKKSGKRRFDLLINEQMLAGGMVNFYLYSTDRGVKILVGIEPWREAYMKTGKIVSVSPEQYAHDLIQEIQVKTKRLTNSSNAKTKHQLPAQPREDQQVKTTMTHYGVTRKSMNQEIVSQLMATTDRTYRRYRDNGWLLSEQEFVQITGESMETYWKNNGGG